MINSLSIVIPLFNGEKFIGETLQHLSRIRNGIHEIIVINDGSADNSESIVSEFLLNDNRIKLFSQPNRGVGRARNFGFSLSSCSYICFLDCDDLITEEFVNRAIASLTNGSDVFIARSARFQHEPHDCLSEFVLDDSFVRRFPESLIENNVIVPSMVAVKKDTVLSVGLFSSDESLWEDWDYWIRLAIRGVVFDFFHQYPIVHYRMSNESRSAAFAKGCERCIQTLIKHRHSGLVHQTVFRRRIAWWLRMRANSEPSFLYSINYYFMSLSYAPLSLKTYCRILLSFRKLFL